jgi:hypothetical protein
MLIPQPLALGEIAEPFDDLDWFYEIKHYLIFGSGDRLPLEIEPADAPPTHPRIFAHQSGQEVLPAPAISPNTVV